jgi:hypothetical protein
VSRKGERQLLEEIKRVAGDDLELVAEEIAAREDDGGDGYFEAVGLHQRADERLATAKTLEDVRAVARLAGRARQALTGAEDAVPCFFDARHGPSARPTLFAPEGGALRPVPACEACAEELDVGRMPPLRRVIVDGRPQPYWRSPAHAGYAGRGGESLEDLLEAYLGGRPGGQLAGTVGFGLLELVLDSWT